MVQIRVYLVSNYRLLLDALTDLMEAQSPSFLLAGSADSYAQAREQIPKTAVDVVLLDIDSNVDAVLALITDLQAVSAVKVLLLTRMENPALEDKAILSGARGLIDRETSPQTLLTALQSVHEGQVWLNRQATGRIFVEISRSVSQKAADSGARPISSLTQREKEIVVVMARHSAKPGKTIAEKLYISESTLRNHLTAIYDKLGVGNRNGLLAYAYRNGLVEQADR